jgi:hypothetical protein
MGRIDHQQIKLGKLPCVHDDRNLKLANYLITPSCRPCLTPMIGSGGYPGSDPWVTLMPVIVWWPGPDT